MSNSKTRLSSFSAVLLAWLLFPGGLFQSTQGGGAFSPAAQLIHPVSRIPLHFIENRGQVERPAEYYLRHSTGSVRYYPDSIVYQSIRPSNGDDQRRIIPEEGPGEAHQSARVSNIRARFVGASPQATVKGVDRAEARVSHFRGSDPAGWVSRAPTYRRILYEGIYPGIDFVAAGNAGGLKHEYIVKPGADARTIRLNYQGIQSLSVNDGGQLEIDTGEGVLIEDKPVAYQVIDGESVEVAVSYTVREFDLTYDIADYRKDLDLIIDPSLLFSTFLGGSQHDYAYETALDETGNIYMTGYTYSSDFPTTPGVYDTTFNTGLDVIVTKFNPTGSTLVFSTFVGGNDEEKGTSIALDGTGNAYVTGYTESYNFPTTGGAYDTSFASPDDKEVFVFKLSSDGSSLLYSTFLGGSYREEGWAIAVDASGNACVTGINYSTDFPLTGGVFDTTFGVGEAFVTKLNSTGTGLVFSTFLGGDGIDIGYGIVIDPSGYIYVSGDTRSTDLATFGAYDTTYAGNKDAFIAKINPTATALQFATYLGGVGGENCWGGIAVDTQGNSYVTGFSDSADYPTTSGAYDETYNGASYNVFVTKLNAAGTGLGYSTYLGGSNYYQYGRGIAVDRDGRAYVVGYSRSTDFPTTPNAYDSTYNGELDIFVTLFNPDGSNLLYSTLMGGSSSDVAEGIAIDHRGNLVLTGCTSSSNYPTTAGAYDTVKSGFDDAVVAKFHLTNSILVDFSSVGLWLWNAGTWSQMSGVDAGYMMAANVDAAADVEFVIDFDSVGLWRWQRNVWEQLSGVDTDYMVAANTDGSGSQELVVDFGSIGLWHWDDGAWEQMSGVNSEDILAADVDGNNDAELLVDFGTLGLWKWDGGAWEQLSVVNPSGLAAANIDGNNDDEVFVDFGGLGLWKWDSGVWEQINSLSPEGMNAADTDGDGSEELIVDLGAQGLWTWAGGVWTLLSGINPEFAAAADLDGDGDDEIITDFGTTGLWKLEDGGWTQMSSANASYMVATDTDGNGTREVAVDFGAIGVWLWNDGTWTQLAGVDPDFMVVEEID